jgi:hypothetical protein
MIVLGNGSRFQLSLKHAVEKAAKLLPTKNTADNTITATMHLAETKYARLFFQN